MRKSARRVPGPAGSSYRRKSTAQGHLTGVPACRALGAVLAVVGLAACAASLKGYPDQSIDPKAELDALAEYLKPDVLTKYESANPADRHGLSQQAWRNAVIDARLRADDLHFNDYQQGLYQEGVGTGIGTDFAVLALSGAGAVAGGAANALSAASAGVTGARASFDKNAYFDKTLPTLLSTMVARRKQILLQIRQGETKSTDVYPLLVALNDLDSYYYAGTIPGALTDIAATAGASITTADKALKDLKGLPTVGPIPADVQKRVVAVLDFIDDLVKRNDKTGLDSLAEKLGAAKVADIKDVDQEKRNVQDKVNMVGTKDQMDALAAQIKSIPQFKDKEF